MKHIDPERRKALVARREELKKKLYRQQQRESRKDLLNQLDSQLAQYKIIWAEHSVANPISAWIEESFAVAWWGRIDWTLVPNCDQRYWNINQYSDLLATFKHLLLDHQLGNPIVIVTWTDASLLSLELSLSLVAQYAEWVFQEDWDTWIICLEQSWCIECYHEGELCFGYSQKKVSSRL
jgi:hypothetical protein